MREHWRLFTSAEYPFSGEHSRPHLLDSCYSPETILTKHAAVGLWHSITGTGYYSPGVVPQDQFALFLLLT